MTKVAILTEGGSAFGFGHLTRCLALSQAFSCFRNVQVEFLVHGDDAASEFLAGSSAHAVTMDWCGSPLRVQRKAREWQVMIVDSYHAPASFFRAVHRQADKPYLVAIDDYHRLAYQADMVIRPSLHEEKAVRSRRREPLCLTGNKYVIVRKDFWRRSPRKKTAKIRKLLITLGGTDVRNLTPRVLDAVNRRFPEWEKAVIADRAFLQHRSMSVSGGKKTRFFGSLSAGKMRLLMAGSDAAVSAGGQTLGELASVGTPAVVIGTARNQIENIQGYEKAGAIEFAGWWRDNALMDSMEKALIKINDGALLSKMTIAGRRLVDGQGACRLAQKILELEKSRT